MYAFGSIIATVARRTFIASSKLSFTSRISFVMSRSGSPFWACWPAYFSISNSPFTLANSAMLQMMWK